MPVVKVIILLTVTLLPQLLFSQAGTLDSTFDDDGLVFTEVGTNAKGNDLVIQNDGKIVLGGFSGPLGHEDYILTRYNEDGSLDTSFDNDGIVITNISTDNDGDYAYAVALQPDGKILLGGNANMNPTGFEYCLLRFNNNGSLDTSFGGDGIVTTTDGGTIKSLVIQQDGKILANGYTYVFPNTVISTIRYNSDGSIDGSFGTNGIVYTDPTGHGGTATDIDVQSDGKIVICGYGYDSITISGHDIYLLRYNTDGSPDTSFGTNGFVITALGPETDAANTLLIQPDGKIIIGGEFQTDGHADMTVLRYNTNGSLDTTFDDDGVVITEISPENDNIWDATFQADGKIVVAGGVYKPTQSIDFVLVRYNGDGSRDTTFGLGNGIITTDINHDYNWANAVGLQDDGKIVIGGTFYDVSTYDDDMFVLARYKGDCSNTIADFNYAVTNNVVEFTSTATAADEYLWDFGNGNTSVDENPVYTYNTDGIYDVCQVTSNSCSSDTFCQSITIISTSDNPLNVYLASLTLSPNPFSGKTIIQFSIHQNSEVTIELFDLQGKRIKTIAEGNFEAGKQSYLLQKENLASGMYLLYVQTCSGTSVHKLIIE